MSAITVPLPVMPGLQAVKYEPGAAEMTRSRVMPGPMFSTSATIRSPSEPRT